MNLHYEEALEKLKNLAKQTEWYAEFNVLALALHENLEEERRFGSTELSRRARYELVYRLDQLTSNHQINVPFSALVSDPTQAVSLQPGESLPVPSQRRQEIKRVVPLKLGTHEKWAVLVGINQYEDVLSYGQLKVCVQDATSLFTTLNKGKFKTEQMYLLTDHTSLIPSRERILTTLELIAQATEPDDLLLFYFSGHGRLEEGESYLIPRNGTASVRYTGIALSSIKSIMLAAQARAKVIILDACHSGTTLQAKGKPFMSEEFINDVFRDAEGLAIISSCQQGQLSYEWPEKQCSVFTYYLLEALQGRAKLQENGLITVGDVNRHVTHGVKQWAISQGVIQAPRLHYVVTGEIVLLECPEETTPLHTQEESNLSETEKHIHSPTHDAENLATLLKGPVHQELAERLAKEEGFKLSAKLLSSNEDALERYRAIPLHALFLYTSEDQAIVSYLSKHLADLDELTDTICDVYPIVEQFKRPYDANAYVFMRELDVLRNAHFDAYEQLPVLFFWDGKGASEYISLSSFTDLASVIYALRQIFGTLRRAPTISSVSRIKSQLQQAEKSSAFAHFPKQNGPGMPSRASDQRDQLYQIMQLRTNDLDLQEICLAVNIHYNRLRGSSHAEKVFSLTTILYNQDRLNELEEELHKRFPKRFA
ncbi:caspase family protein [Ktedonosporobacter rubrisoli]|uniref:Caspase family protein n=1 Tax=Ktedonosporobacter rubrisoli TaxID=2509675 RepID=A0A4P6K5W0_KTERU|nr:caspase family protein [Ktedonosporobacter rubrisoli]QBD82936.1 caspase family protein [Ktedonosporobacter rubrisoli]